MRRSLPSAFRCIDLILCDVASQYGDREWSRFFSCIKEQPRPPFVVVVADFQQLQPVVVGGLCKTFCDKLQKCPQDTLDRSRDEDHMFVRNRVRCEQLDMPRLEEYFGYRHWTDHDLRDCVRSGMPLAEEAQQPFAWLTCTNKGARGGYRAALDLAGVTEEELDTGYYCDPTSKSDLRIVFKKGVVCRLTRNFDTQRGFVNGALAVGEEQLEGEQSIHGKAPRDLQHGIDPPHGGGLPVLAMLLWVCDNHPTRAGLRVSSWAYLLRPEKRNPLPWGMAMSL